MADTQSGNRTEAIFDPSHVFHSLMLRTNQTFDEVQVYEGVAERTGATAARHEVRGSKHVCRSMSELTNKARRLGDGHFYLPTEAWPAGQSRVVLTVVWTPMG